MMHESKKKTEFCFCLVLFLLLFTVTVSAVSFGDWAGYVFFSGSIASDGTYVTAHINNASTASGTARVGSVESGTGYYLIHVDGTQGDPVNFKICGISVAIPSQTLNPGLNVNSTSGSPYINLSVSKLATGACSYSCACSGNYCCSGATEYTDGSGTGTCQASVCTAPTTTTTTGGGGGGGATTNVTIIPSASPSSPAVVNIGTDQSNTLKVYQVTVRVTENVSNAQITVKEASLPAGASLAISSDNGAIYKYLNITTTVPSSKIANVTIKFKVEKSWITANDINSSTIALERYVNGQWVKLTTTKLSEDSIYIYFEAQSPGLSIFAIIGEKNITPSVTPSCPACPQPSAWSACINNKQTRTNYTCDATTNNTCQSYTETKDCPKPTSIWASMWASPWIRLLAVVIVVALLWGLTKAIVKRKRIEYHESKTE
jgi:PGF-pre-PGF domain-containing protein